MTCLTEPLGVAAIRSAATRQLLPSGDRCLNGWCRLAAGGVKAVLYQSSLYGSAAGIPSLVVKVALTPAGDHEIKQEHSGLNALCHRNKTGSMSDRIPFTSAPFTVSLVGSLGDAVRRPAIVQSYIPGMQYALHHGVRLHMDVPGMGQPPIGHLLPTFRRSMVDIMRWVDFLDGHAFVHDLQLLRDHDGGVWLIDPLQVVVLDEDDAQAVGAFMRLRAIGRAALSTLGAVGNAEWRLARAMQRWVRTLWEGLRR